MEKIVKFNDVGSASRVAQHLYGVVQNSEKLVFSNFDEAAFKTAVALEDLTKTDYSYAGNSPISPARTTVAFRPFGRPRVALDFTLEGPENHYHVLSLNVLTDTAVTPSDRGAAFPLAIDLQLFYLIRILQRAMRCGNAEQKQAVARTVTNLERACMQIRDRCFSRGEPARCNLVLHGSHQSCEISLDLLDVSLNINRSIFE